ncbi:MAG: SAM-dependent methyltransferase [Rhodospirillaceae bacterium]|nr:SAM-dependent methyltransferase [Rhodospirillaceae bacterium]
MRHSIPNHRHGRPSPWITRFASKIASGSKVLDLACGNGRHSRYLLRLGHTVTACDINISALTDIKDEARLEIIACDLENSPWPFGDRHFAAIIITNYLHRPLFPDVVATLAPAGLLLYETFAAGNEAFGRPRNPKYLLKRGELISGILDNLTIIAYEDVTIDTPHPACVQRVCARNSI